MLHAAIVACRAHHLRAARRNTTDSPKVDRILAFDGGVVNVPGTAFNRSRAVYYSEQG
jgi:hypothetical protein